MTDHPIIFSAPMIRALLDGRKTQTRRVLKPQPYPFSHPDNGQRTWNASGCVGGRICISDRDLLDLHRKPAPGDRLYVREVWAAHMEYDPCKPLGIPSHEKVWRSSDGPLEPVWIGRKRSPIHMPRWASRLTLTVMDVQVQRLQDISEADAMDEGATPRANCWGFMSRDQGWSMDWSQVGRLSAYATGATRTAKAPLTESDISLSDPRMAFASYFNDIHAPDAWDANPWVVAITFDVHRGNIDEIAGMKGGDA